jgi:hypothetical protein
LLRIKLARLITFADRDMLQLFYQEAPTEVNQPLYFYFYWYIQMQIIIFYDPEGDAFQTETEVSDCIALCLLKRL